MIQKIMCWLGYHQEKVEIYEYGFSVYCKYCNKILEKKNFNWLVGKDK